MNRVALYARYSSEKQSDTSIDDQLRRCRELAVQHGMTVSDALVFTDAAMSGTDAGTHKRKGFHAFVKAWEAGEIDVFIVDDLSRLSRDGVEQAKLMQRLENNRRVRMLTVDGIDTRVNDWQLRLGIQGVLAQQDIRKIRGLVGRGMLGQLERGYMVATPPFGFGLRRVLDDRGARIGTHWDIKEDEAKIVRTIFDMRKDGSSLNRIAAWLNSSGVPTSRKPMNGNIEIWRPSRVRILLTNTIYRGTFIWHGSTTHAWRARKRGDEVNPKYYPREHLRLISDETWNLCNEKKHSRSGYGGGKHYLAGLITCNCCGGTLVLSAGSPKPSVYCANCVVSNAVKPGGPKITSTVSITGIKSMLSFALAQFLTPGFFDAFHTSLKMRLTGGQQNEVEECRRQLKHLKAAQERFSRMLSSVTDDDAVLEQRYRESQRDVKKVTDRLSLLEAGCAALDKKALAAQLSVDPRPLLEGLLDESLPPERLRALLCRLFPSIVFEGKESTRVSYFRIRFAQGAVLAIASETDQVSDACVELRCRLSYRQSFKDGSGGWSASLLPLK